MRECTALKFVETAQTDPAFPDEGPASRFTKLSANLSGAFPLDIGVTVTVNVKFM